MLDIAVIIPELRKYGGAERVVLECMRRWQRRHKLTLYASNTNLDLLAEAGIDKVSVKALSPPFEGEHEVLLNSILLPKLWQAEIGDHDVYHAHLWPTHLIDRHPMVWYPHEPLRLLYDLLYSLSITGEGAEIEHFLHFYPKLNYDKVSHSYYEAVLRAIHTFDTAGRPDQIVANSRSTARYLEAVYGRDVTGVVYPGVTAEKSRDAAPLGKFVLVVGQLWRHKRTRLAIEAIHHVKDTDLYIVGSGPEEDNLRTAADRLGVADRVFFMSGLNNREVQLLFNRCLCCVFVPVREPFGIVALEALAAGKPLIAVNEGGYTEVVDEKCAFLVPPEPLAIADRIKRLQTDPKLAQRMGAHGQKIARKYNWDRTANELIAIIEACYRGAKARRRLARKTDRAVVGAHYFTWYREGYGNNHWHDTESHGAVSEFPRIGYYDSTDGDTIRYHLKLMREAKLDFVCFNLHVNDSGLDAHELRGATVMCEIARATNSGLRFAVNLCLYTREQRPIEQAVDAIRQHFLRSDDALKFRGKPVLFIFWTGAFDQDHNIIHKLETLCEGTVRIALSSQSFDPSTEARKTFDFFDAFCLFSPLEAGPISQWEPQWLKAYDTGNAMRGHCRVLTISPGYDDRLLQDPIRQSNPFREVSREDGATYRRMMDFGLRQKALLDITLISTFNEFHENTHIEPTTRIGDAYLRLTADYVSSLKRKVARRTK